VQSKKTFKIATLGCRTNQYESQAYADQLRALGYEEAGEGEEAELCIVNTCTVTESADSHSRHQIRSLMRHHPGARLVVTGCAAEHLPEELRAGVRIVPNAQKEELLSVLFPDEELPEFAIRQFAAHTRAFVKVQDGCNAFCTYCIIPYVRGRSRSRPVAEIVREVEGLVAQGFKEVVLTGINIGDFEEGEKRLADLVRAVDQIAGLQRLRLSSIDPDEVDGPLMDAVLGGRTTCPSLHIVLQSGSDVILKRMNRKYTRQVFLETVRRLREARPAFTFTTDVIVGFPGESDDDFAETLDVMHSVRLAKVHMFPYSERKRTRAALYPNKVPFEVIQERKQAVLRASERIAFQLRAEAIGTRARVLVEGEEKGHTEHFLPVFVPGAQRNELIDVELIDNTPDSLVGRRVH
jgi:threonylcarbamoyladenosine tRNA methylthiotransferase MtaB